VLVGVTALVLRAALLPIEPMPEPVIHDEFGYLLAADTFAHGRLANPTHPMWEHFESFSIIQKPTYQCFAQPAQGMLLAVGQVILRHPFWGVWLSVGMMCAAITWMLQGWLLEEWALLGGMLAILRFATFSYWANSYWGGAAGAIGGALVLGAWPRIRSSQRPRDALIMAVGLAVLANSRPYEGVVFSLPIAVALFAWFFRRQAPGWRVLLPRVIVPLCVALIVVGVGMGYYFIRVTGSPFRMPYQIERETYAVAPYLLWQHSRPMPTYRHLEFKKMYGEDDVKNFELAHSRMGLALFGTLKVGRMWSFFFGPAFSLPFLMMALVLPFGFTWGQIQAETRFLIVLVGVFFAGLMAESYFEPHYAAPVTCVFLALTLMAMRRLQDWKPSGRRVGAALNGAVVVVCLLSSMVRGMAAARGWELSRSEAPAWHQVGPKSFGRAAVAARLNQLPGKQLVIVRYTIHHEVFEEWVYNDADIDGSKVVWARNMGAAENAKLVDYFKDRQVWLLEADEEPPKVTPYLGATTQTEIK
jgi:MFS family permease